MEFDSEDEDREAQAARFVDTFRPGVPASEADEDEGEEVQSPEKDVKEPSSSVAGRKSSATAAETKTAIASELVDKKKKKDGQMGEKTEKP